MRVVEDLATLPLHDSIMLNLAMDWQDRVCTAEVQGGLAPGTTGARIRWTDVTRLEVSRQAPWGPSLSILEARGPIDGRYEITMQSGDVIAVSAGGCTIEFV